MGIQRHESAERHPQLNPDVAGSRKSKTRTTSTLRPSNTMLMSSMIDSLAALEAPVSGDMRRYHQTVQGGQHTSAHGAWYTREGRVPSPSTRSSSRFALHPSRNSAALNPSNAIVNTNASPKMASRESGDQTPSRPSSARYSADGSRKSKRKSRRRTTHEMSAFGPSHSADIVDEGTEDRNGYSEPAVTASSGGVISEITAGTPVTPERNSKRRTVSSRTAAPSLRIVTEPQPDHPVNGDRSAAERQHSPEAQRWKGKAVASNDSSAPLDRLMTTPADLIPTRRSSLHYSSRPVSRKSLRKTRSSEQVADLPKDLKKDALTEEVFTELGEEDETVRRIRQLQEQKQQRMRSLDINQTPDASGQHHNGRPYSGSSKGKLPSRPGSADTSTGARRFMPLSNSPGSRAPDNAKASRLLGLADASPESPQSPLPFASRLERPFDPAMEYAALDQSSTAESSPERSDSNAYHDYALYMRESGAQERTLVEPAEAESAPDHISEVAREVTRAPSALSGKRSASARRSHHRRTSTADTKIKGYRASVDEDIEAYINHPRLNRTVRHELTGRIISFSEVGDPKGFPVLVCVGMGLTRFVSAFYDDLARTLGLRLITPDRPGIGKSDPLTSRDILGPLGWREDIRTICAHLSIGTFSLLAHSAGAVYALALSLSLPDHIAGPIRLLAPWIPPSQTDPNPDVPFSQRLLRILPTPFLKAANAPLLSRAGPASTPRPESFAAAYDPADPELLQPGATAALRAQRLYSAATNGANPAQDLIVCLERHRPVGFSYASVALPVTILHGSEDRRVRADAVRGLVARWDTVRRARGDGAVELRILEGEGHGLMSSASVMGAVLGEIAEQVRKG